MNKNKLLTGGLAAAGILGTCAAAENTLMLRTAHYETDIPGLPRLVQLSDLHRRQFGREQNRLIRRVSALNPDYIIITGDLISRKMRDFTETARLLRRLRALAPVLTIYGNHELDLPPEADAAFRDMLRRCSICLLENEIVRIGRAEIPVAGIPLTRLHYRGGGLLRLRGKKSCTAEELYHLLGRCPENTVLLAHNPIFFDAYAAWGARLTLSGHVHGGIVRLPGIGGILSPERRFFPRYDKGLFRQGDSEMIVSAGLGKLRFLNPPELCLITGSKL